jgi:sorbitol/mannitol transport system permease protein
VRWILDGVSWKRSDPWLTSFAWNEYFLANLLTAVVARTTPPFLGSFVDGRGQFLAVLSAACTLAVLAVIVAGWLAQKRLVRGLAMGAVK